MLRVYTASKIDKAPMWKSLMHDPDWSHVFFHSRWVKSVLTNKLADVSPDNAARAWIEDLEDVKSADYLLVYGESGEHLRGALVEVGVALSETVPVIAVGEHPSFGTWQYHPLVIRLNSLNTAADYLKHQDSLRMKAARTLR